MTLYEPDREGVNRIKAAMEKAVIASKRPYYDAVERELHQALKQDLHKYREAVWTSARLVAAYEFAAEHRFLTIFNSIWSDFEKRGGFKAAKLNPPVTVKESAK